MELALWLRLHKPPWSPLSAALEEMADELWWETELFFLLFNSLFSYKTYMSQELTEVNLTDHSRASSWVEKHYKHKCKLEELFIMQKNSLISVFQKDFLGSNLELDRQAIFSKLFQISAIPSRGWNLALASHPASEPKSSYSTKAATTYASLILLPTLSCLSKVTMLIRGPCQQ